MHICCCLQAWLVPYASEEEAGNIGCGCGPVPAVHSGFAASWQHGLKAAVCQMLKQAVKQSGQPASSMRMLITGDMLCMLRFWCQVVL